MQIHRKSIKRKRNKITQNFCYFSFFPRIILQLAGISQHLQMKSSNSSEKITDERIVLSSSDCLARSFLLLTQSHNQIHYYASSNDDHQNTVLFSQNNETASAIEVCIK